MAFRDPHIQLNRISGTQYTTKFHFWDPFIQKMHFWDPNIQKWRSFPSPFLIRIALIENYFCENFKILEQDKKWYFILKYISCLFISTKTLTILMSFVDALIKKLKNVTQFEWREMDGMEKLHYFYAKVNTKSCSR